MNDFGLALATLIAFLSLVTSSSAIAYDGKKVVTGHDLPKELQDVGISEKLGQTIDLATEFFDDSGKPVTLGKYFRGDRPVLFSIVYYNCPSLCNFHLNGVTEALKKLEWTVGEQFELVALSMNHREKPDLAGSKKAAYVKDYERPESLPGWHFLTGTEENIAKVAGQVGFKFKWLPEQQDYSHASAAIIMTPEGKISRYLHGVQFDAQTIKLALLEASNGRIGSIVDQVVMYCFLFDPNKRKFTLRAFRVMQIGATLVVLLLALILIPLWLKERKAIEHSR